jgi:hypothetical protein
MEAEKIILGFTEEITDCDCCGKSDLKGTYAISLNGYISYFGSVCAFKIHAVSYKEQKEIKKECKRRVKAADKLKQMEADYNGTQYQMDQMLKFVEKSNLDITAFILKYGKVVDELKDFFIYNIGSKCKAIPKKSD